MTIPFLIKRLDALLAPIGFTRKSSVWNRRAETLIDVIEVVRSKVGNSVTLEAGVLDPAVYDRLWHRDPPAFAKCEHCVIRTRIGSLLDGRDLWWSSEEAVSDLENSALRLVEFAERMHSKTAQLAFLRSERVSLKHYPPPIINLAMLQYDAGSRDEACTLLRELAQTIRSNSWRTEIARIMTGMGCRQPVFPTVRSSHRVH